MADGTQTRRLLQDDVSLNAMLTARFVALLRERSHTTSQCMTHAEVMEAACGWGDAAGLPPLDTLQHCLRLDSDMDGTAPVTDYEEFCRVTTEALQHVAEQLQCNPMPYTREKSVRQVTTTTGSHIRKLLGNPTQFDEYCEDVRLVLPQTLVTPAEAVPGALRVLQSKIGLTASTSLSQACPCSNAVAEKSACSDGSATRLGQYQDLEHCV